MGINAIRGRRFRCGGGLMGICRAPSRRERPKIIDVHAPFAPHFLPGKLAAPHHLDDAGFRISERPRYFGNGDKEGFACYRLSCLGRFFLFGHG